MSNFHLSLREGIVSLSLLLHYKITEQMFDICSVSNSGVFIRSLMILGIFPEVPNAGIMILHKKFQLYLFSLAYIDE